MREVGEQILFLHRLQPGGADRSYGIEVGRLAGLPSAVLVRARAVLALLEGELLVPRLRGERPPPASSVDTEQLALFGALPHPVVEQLRRIDVNTLTPLEALSLLATLAADARRLS